MTNSNQIRLKIKSDVDIDFDELNALKIQTQFTNGWMLFHEISEL